MRFKKIAGVITTSVLVAVMSVAGMSAAYAEGEPPVEEITTSTVVEETAPAVESAPVQETVAVEPVVEPAPAPPVEAPSEPAPLVEETPESLEAPAETALSPPVPTELMVETFEAKDNGYDSEQNKPSYWENTEHESSCYKHEANKAGWSSNAHGKSLGDEVWLNEFDEDAWEGDHWERLVIKAGQENTVIEHPVAGTHYSTDNGKTVSHWIVCKGETPPVLNDCVSGTNTHSTQLADLWSNTGSRSAGHSEYVENGLHVWTDNASSEAKISEGMAVNFPLHDTGVLDIDWEGTSPAPGLNLYVNFGSDGSGILVYEEVYGQDLWLTNGSSAAVKANAPVIGGGNGSQWHGTIDQWLTKYPEAQVVGLSYSLGSGVHGDGIIKSITANCSVHTFDYVAPPTYTPNCQEVSGHVYLDGDGVLTVEGEWATDEIDVPFTGTLADIGTSSTLNIDADPLAFVGLHIDTAEGTIVFEEEASYGGNLWSTSTWAGVNPGMGYAAFGSIEQFVHLNGDVQVTGIRLLYTHPTGSSTTVESFTIGCTLYTFKGEQPPAPETVVTETEPEITCETEVGSEQTLVRTTVTGEYVWTEGEWVLEETTTTEDFTYTVTAEDIEALECPVPEVPEKPVPPTKVTSGSLPFTGFNEGLLAFAGWLLLIGGATVGGMRLIKGRN